MKTPHIEEFFTPQIPDADRAAMNELSGIVYPPHVVAGIVFPKSAPPPDIAWPPARQGRTFLLRVEGRLVATSQIVPRRIKTTRGMMDVLGLAGVKTHPDFRLHGFGAKVVRAAFAYVDNGTFGLSLFQTRVAGFYEKLGCRRVDNEFLNSLAEDPHARPWWDAQNLIYPASCDWPGGVVDLLGPAW